MSRKTMWIRTRYASSARVLLLLTMTLIITVVPAYAGTAFDTGSTNPVGSKPFKLTLSGRMIEHGTPAVADFDGDGDKEIVIGGRDGVIYVLAHENGRWSVVWQRQMADDLNAAGAPTSCEETRISDMRSSPAIADMDGDGKLELVVTAGGYNGPADSGGTHRNGGVLVYRFNAAWNFSVVPGWPQPRRDVTGKGPGASEPDGCWDGIFAAPALADVDGDGTLDVVVNSLDRALHAWTMNGVYIAGWPKNAGNLGISRGGWSAPAIADLDGDGKNEIVIGTDNVTTPGSRQYKLFAFDDDGSVMPGFPVLGPSNFYSSPAIGDINNDGSLDIVVGTGTFERGRGNRVFAWNARGKELPGWPQITEGDMQASPALGDLDGDGDLEVVIGCGQQSDVFPNPPCTKLYAWHGDGRPVRGFPMTPANGMPGGGAPNILFNSPVLADFDGDGKIEILTVPRWSWTFAVVEGDGTDTTNEHQLEHGNYVLVSAPVVDDLDGDGFLEVVIGTGANQDRNGAVFIWEAEGRADAARPWPMQHQNVARTGVAARPPSIAPIPGHLFMHDRRAGGKQATGKLLIQNQGDGSFQWRIRHNIAGLTISPSSGTATDSAVVTLTYDVSTLNTKALSQQNKKLGNLTFTATDTGGNAIEGSPQTVPITLFDGNVAQVHLPTISR